MPIQQLVQAVLGVLLICTGCGSSGSDDYQVVGQSPHDVTAYTQGLVLAEGQLYESTGRYGQSQVRLLDRATGDVTASRPLASDRFGEGLAFFDGKLFQLTWKAGVGYIYDAETLTPLDSFAYDGEGWGLTSDG